MKKHLLVAALSVSVFTLAEAQVTPAIASPAATRKPEISINDGNFTDGKTKLEFITPVLSEAPASQVIIIENLGLANLTGIKVVIDGPGKANFKTTRILKTSLSPNLSTSFKLRFKPIKEAPVNATLHILSNDSDEKSFDIKLSGRVGLVVTPSASSGRG